MEGRGVSPGPPNPNVKWCPECERYYNSTAQHECVDKEVNQNRRALERWLGRFKIREEGK